MYPFIYRHLLTRFDAERVHHLALRGLRLAGLPPLIGLLRLAVAPRPMPGMSVSAFGKQFAHPLGLAAGFDKDGVALTALSALGFSFIEVGTITPQPQVGNPRPRLFRLMPDHALINRMGFPSQGMAIAAQHLKRRPSLPIGISIGKNKSTPLEHAKDDYQAALRYLHPHGDFFVINVSSPNTPELRQLQTPAYLDDLLAATMETVRHTSSTPKPLLIKIAPDLSTSEVETILQLGLKHRIAGIIATNTTLDREHLKSAAALESGGLSGAPLRNKATELVRFIRRQIGDQLLIIGVGGIFTGRDVWEKILAGATLVQAYTGFIYRGIAFNKHVIDELYQIMNAEGVAALADVIGQG
ncbi:MAG: quinone-dependent dihydroorotate dehydrogenase [Anaerolineae bacterium]